MTDMLGDMAQAVSSLVLGSSRELITLLRTPTPIKVVKVVTTDEHGCIGGGLDVPNDPVALYECPMSQEAWLHRISFYSDAYPAGNPLSTGQLLLTGTTAGEIIGFAPVHGDICPVQILEGRLSAPHLNSGERVMCVGDQLPPGVQFRFDFQVVLQQGISEFTPTRSSPTNLEKDRLTEAID